MRRTDTTTRRSSRRRGVKSLALAVLATGLLVSGTAGTAHATIGGGIGDAVDDVRAYWMCDCPPY